MIALVDRPARVAAVVAAESAWVPAWHRVVAQAQVLLALGLAVVVQLSPEGAAVVATVVALASRVAPMVLVRGLHSDDSLAQVRRVRERLLTAYAATGMLIVATVPRAVPNLACVGVAAIAFLLVGLQHRPPPQRAWCAVAAEWVEMTAVVALLPILALATVEWWR